MRKTLLLSLAGVVGLAVPALLGLVLVGRIMISAVFEQGKFDEVAGNLTYDVLTIYALALPAYVVTEVVTRGLISMRDTRSPLLTNTVQLIGRGAIMTALINSQGVLAIPIAFAVTASVETLALGAILAFKLAKRGRLQTAEGMTAHG